MPLLNIDQRVLVVDATGAAMGTSGNPIFTSAAASSGTQNVQGVQAAGATITENPVLIAGQNAGNVKLWALDGSGNPTVNQGATGSGGASGWFAQGQSAAGAALAGNPLTIGGRDASGNAQFIGGNNAGIFAQGGVAIGAATSGGNPVFISGGDATNNTKGVRVFGSAGDNTAASVEGMFTNSEEWLYNGTGWDKRRNNIDVTFLTSASRNTTQGPTNITTFNARAIYFWIVCTAGTGTVTFKIDAIDPASGNASNLLTGTAVTNPSTNIYKVGVGLTAAANAVANEYLPRTVAITLTSNLTSLTYSAGYSLIGY